MAGGRRSGADRVLESRHLVGLFLGVVLLCGVFFTLGYVMGKTGGPVRADSLGKSSPPARTSAPASDVATDRANSSSSGNPSADTSANSTPAASEWDFYTQKKSEHLEPNRPAPSPASAIVARSQDSTTRPVPTAARYQAPHMVKGSIVLQIAALTRQGDALAMADELQQKRFPAFVVSPSSDNFYRVQVGPYTDERAADAAKTDLDRAGFKAITKR
jgi:DedD protein